ncbi:MAG: TonB-dependent receptor, partial [Thermoanaerobaculaceae bacterium]|nr:TonB-dependent receptor [Thermoanaerobaculaceae bacterium]
MKRFAIVALLVGMVALPLFAQNPTGTLTGHVTDGKTALPGVTVTISSPNMQGTRTAVTTVAGDYILNFLPPGEYKVRFELQGFQTLETTIKLSAAQTSKLDAEMPAATVAEEVTVTGTYETIAASGTAATTFEKSLINKLPIAKDLNASVLLTAGVNSNGPNAGISIAGSQSYENLFMVNGVVVNENLRGQPLPLYIEDAIQETTTSVSAVSAEYGRFSGGVVNTLTKSGGNEFHASLRDTMNNQMWVGVTPITTAVRDDKILNTYEATLGGYVFTDKLW